MFYSWQHDSPKVHTPTRRPNDDGERLVFILLQLEKSKENGADPKSAKLRARHDCLGLFSVPTLMHFRRTPDGRGDRREFRVQFKLSRDAEVTSMRDAISTMGTPFTGISPVVVEDSLIARR